MDGFSIFLFGGSVGALIGFGAGLTVRKERAIAMGSENELLGEVKRRRREIRISREIDAEVEHELKS